MLFSWFRWFRRKPSDPISDWDAEVEKIRAEQDLHPVAESCSHKPFVLKGPMKLSEAQALQLLQIARAAADESTTVGGLSDGEIYDLLDEIQGQCNDTPVQLADNPTTLS